MIVKMIKSVTGNRIRRLSLLLVAIIIVSIPVIVLAPNDRGSDEPSPLEIAENRWRDYGSDHYQMTVVGIGLPTANAALRLLIENGVIVDESIIACDNPSDDYPENLCEPTRTWYSSFARYTINDLFGKATQCIAETRLAVRDCAAVPDDFQQFEVNGTMGDIARSCEINTGERDTLYSLCSVRYNETYGYPEEMFFFMPNAHDGGGSITVRDFQLMND